MLHGEPVQRQVTLTSGRTGRAVQLTVNYDNAVAAVERSLRSDNEATRRLVSKFLVTRTCPVCHGTRLLPEALQSQLGGLNLAGATAVPAAAIERGQEQGEFSSAADPGVAAEILTSVYFGTVSRWLIDGPPPFDLARALAQRLESVLVGLQTH